LAILVAILRTGACTAPAASDFTLLLRIHAGKASSGRPPALPAAFVFFLVIGGRGTAPGGAAIAVILVFVLIEGGKGPAARGTPTPSLFILPREAAIFIAILHTAAHAPPALAPFTPFLEFHAKVSTSRAPPLLAIFVPIVLIGGRSALAGTAITVAFVFIFVSTALPAVAGASAPAGDLPLLFPIHARKPAARAAAAF